MYVHSKDTSAVLNDLGIYVLSKVHKWPHMSCFKNIPKFYTTDPEMRGLAHRLLAGDQRRLRFLHVVTVLIP